MKSEMRTETKVAVNFLHGLRTDCWCANFDLKGSKVRGMAA